MSKRTLEMFENEFSSIYRDQRVVSFHRDELPCMQNDNNKYTVLGLLFINEHFVLVQKTMGLYAIPGGGTETKDKSRSMLEKGFRNAGCNDDLNKQLVDITLQSELDYLTLECVREYVEETSIFIMNPIYFGHQKTKIWRDEIVFISDTAYHFDKDGQPEEILDLSILSKKNFKPIGKSVSKKNPYIIFSIKEMIAHIDKVVDSHKTPIANFLLTQKSKNIDVCFAEKRLRLIAGA